MTSHRHEGRGLNCLLSIFEITTPHRLPLTEMLKRVAQELPASLPRPETACCGIRLGAEFFATDNFMETPWMIRREITVNRQEPGELMVGYVEEPDAADGEPFPDQERKLIGIAAELLGRMLERRRTEAAFEESEKRFRSLVEGALTGISIVQNDRTVYQNPEMERLLGPLPRINKLIDHESIHPEDADKMNTYYQKAKSGSEKPLDIDFRFYPRQFPPDGSGVKWVHCRTVTTRYRGGPALLVNMMDITPTKEMEHLLRVRDKMSSLGRVAAGIAHEIRNPLSGINIYLNTLEKLQHPNASDPTDEKTARILKQLRSASLKIESVIKRVMDFSRPSIPHPVLCDPGLPVAEAVSLSRVTLRKSEIRINVRTDENLPMCLLDATQIEEVILNLITNAAAALKTVDTEKRIRIDTVRLPDGVRITVADSGPGIPETVRPLIFDPFYTTRNGSTGIGLSISRRIVTDHGGRLRVEPSALLPGAAFIIDLPAPEASE